MSNQSLPIYLACPYSDLNSKIRQARFRAVAQCAAHLMRTGFQVFCPITHSHPIQEAYRRGGYAEPSGWQAWQHIDLWALRRCSAVYVLCLPGWSRSKGIRAEVQEARRRRLPVYFMTPDFTRY